MSKEQYKALRQQFIDQETAGSLEQRKFICRTVKYLLIFLGLVARTPRGIAWSFEHTEGLKGSEPLAFNERDYIEERRRLTAIDFKKEAPRALTQAFDVRTHLS